MEIELPKNLKLSKKEEATFSKAEKKMGKGLREFIKSLIKGMVVGGILFAIYTVCKLILVK